MSTEDEPPICEICERPKSRLRRLTKNKYMPVWVCTEKAPKSKMPCDGHAYDVAAKNNNGRT